MHITRGITATAVLAGAAVGFACPAWADDRDDELIADMTAVGIDQDPIHQSRGGLISGARNVCWKLNVEPAQNIVADLEKYSGFNRLQASTYISDAVRLYCPNNAGKLS